MRLRDNHISTYRAGQAFPHQLISDDCFVVDHDSKKYLYERCSDDTDNDIRVAIAEAFEVDMSRVFGFGSYWEID